MIREEHTGLERKKRDALCDTNSKVRLNYSGLITSLKRPRQAEDYVAGQKGAATFFPFKFQIILLNLKFVVNNQKQDSIIAGSPWSGLSTRSG